LQQLAAIFLLTLFAAPGLNAIVPANVLNERLML